MRRLDVLSAAAALLFVATAAQAQRGRGGQRGRQDQHQDQHQDQDQHQQPAPQAQPRQGGGWRGEAQQRGNDRARDDQARAEQARAEQQRAEQARAAAEQSQRRVAEQNYQWRDQQNRQAQQEQAERARQAQQREEQLERERQAQANRAYDRDRDRDRDFRDYDRDRDVRVIHNYRYNIRGVYRETNQFGADVLRQALDRGYDEGYRSGLNDRRDGVRSDFQRALDFESGSFGYAGGYVPADDYSYYFREGFQRGYDDGYWSRSNYGTFSNGKAAILGAVALGILGLTMIR